MLKLPVPELLELRRTAVEEAGRGTPGGMGRPIGQWDPHDLEVHPAGPRVATSPSGTPAARAVPGYVAREHDQVLNAAVRDAAAGCSRIVVLVGSSSTGKTRACWEAVQPLADKGWRLWHPFDPTPAQAALKGLHQVQARTVVWLNEAQQYLGDPVCGERIAAAVHHLLVSPERGPVLVLGSLWPEYEKQYTALPAPGRADVYSRARKLLTGRTVPVHDTFDAHALAEATRLAEEGDQLLAQALTHARTHGRITQDLAGAPQLLNRYHNASPAALAILQAAIDARRLGAGLYLPQAFLTGAAPDYLDDTDWNHLTDDWAEKAYAELAEQVHGKQAPLSKATPRPQRRPPGPTDAPPQWPTGPLFRLADYLEQHGRTTRRPLCPPASFWHAAHTHLTHADDLDRLAWEAETRHRLQWAHHLRHRAADYGSTQARDRLSREGAGEWHGTATIYVPSTVRSDTSAQDRLSCLWEEARALGRQAMLREKAGDQQGAESLARQAAGQGSTDALVRLAELREKTGDRQRAEFLARQAARGGSTKALERLAELREKAGDRQGAETLVRLAADGGDTGALLRLAESREEAGDLESAEALLWQAIHRGDTWALARLVRQRELAGDRDGAESLARQAADDGDTYALFRLTDLREEAGDLESAEALLQQAVLNGEREPVALFRLALVRKKAGDLESAEELLRQAIQHGQTRALYHLVELLERAGDREGAESLARQDAHHDGDTSALYHLVELREEAGDLKSTRVLLQAIADCGSVHIAGGPEVPESFKRHWPYGLDPDGTPTSSWRPSASDR
ncbi:putative protein OS=Streptomyces canus OX=58343 GN=AQI96_40690 PE=4 SV=1 [Streptomyces canus]